MKNQAIETYLHSKVEYDGTLYFLIKNLNDGKKRLVVQGNLTDFQGVKSSEFPGLVCDLTNENAVVLKSRLAWLNPVPLGLKKSFGFGDRLGLATPGHIEALNGLDIAPIFAQQSVRENARTNRTPRQVIIDAMWGIFQAGWRKPWGADADHIKLPELLTDFIDAGYSFYTVDPGDHVNHHADSYSLDELREKVKDAPWKGLSTSLQQIYQDWVDKTISLVGITFTEHTVLKALVKYGNAIVHAKVVYEALRQRLGGQEFDFEVSVDETDSPTTVEEHFFIAHELKRIGVRWTSLAPRFVGRFEKGVDYIGNLVEFEASLKGHVKVAEYFGTYKISLHSGSDKFSVYPLFNQLTHGMLHVKTAGTSYLEALRMIALQEPTLFDEIFAFSKGRYEQDKVSYHVSANLSSIPSVLSARSQYLDEFNSRQVFHVTYGSVLAQFKSEIYAALIEHEDVYQDLLASHFRHHLSLIS